LSRPSTSRRPCKIKDVDAGIKPGMTVERLCMRRTKRRDGRLSFVMAGLVTAFHYLRHGRACPGPKLMASRGSAIVMAGLVPAIHVSAALQDQRRGCRHKAGHDGGEACMRRTKRRDGRLSFVIAGLVPAIHASAALQDQRRGCPA